MKHALNALVLSLGTLSLVSCCSLGFGSCGDRASSATKQCPDCLSKFDPKDECCGNLSEAVIQRASAQGWDGSPHIGLIPTMKPLAE